MGTWRQLHWLWRFVSASFVVKLEMITGQFSHSQDELAGKSAAAQMFGCLEGRSSTTELPPPARAHYKGRTAQGRAGARSTGGYIVSGSPSVISRRSKIVAPGPS